jgi:hypothetical protein
MELLELRERNLDEAQRDTGLAAGHREDRLECCRCCEGPKVGRPKDGRHAPWEQNSCLERQVGTLAAGQDGRDGVAWLVVEWEKDPGDRTSLGDGSQIHSQDAVRDSLVGWLEADTVGGRPEDQVHCRVGRVVRRQRQAAGPKAAGLLVEGRSEQVEQMGEARSSAAVVQL